MKLALIGAGQRGMIYAEYAYFKKDAQIAAIVEPHEGRRKIAAEISGSGYAVTIRYYYDEPGNLTAQQYEDENGDLTDPGIGWARVEYDYDVYGNQTGIRWFGPDGRPVMIYRSNREIGRSFGR